MSMNLFFLAYPQSELDAMQEDHPLIDASVDAERYTLKTDVETAWDVLRHILDGVGIVVGQEIDDALFNGCSLISCEEVQAQAAQLAQWSREQVLAQLQAIEPDADLYHQESFQEDEEYLLEQFDKMRAFYQEAAEKGWGALSYVA